ncbi:cytochrome bc1 complex cytochrome b subunit [Auraticoccus monumenti]|uniref:cytochrome bc1 complex cytochrome b subunit n=1 Tax=Auraticoccus monumenti TaxID=675864 RepID=UPI001E494C07|nr:cytochrome b N-terminal domain-containing protein [Auraticoccus monumenti]
MDDTAGGRLGRLVARLRARAVPNRWSGYLGVVSGASLGVLLVTGVVLMVFYDPSSALVRYHGSYEPLRGVEVSEAYASTLRISLDLRGGLVLRQAHHWAALVLPASVLLQLASLFFTGGFRRPRQWGWVLLVGVLLLAMVSGWSGYALPDDSLSGTGLRIVQGVALGVPVIGTWVTFVLFDGEFPGRIIENLYLVHLAAPALLVVLVVVRLRMAWRDGPAQLPGPGRSESTVVGLPLWPAATVRAGGMFLITTGLLVLMAGTMTISPVWLYGPASPAAASAGSQPDWYMGFLDGALRLVPPGWEVVWLGRTWTLAVLVPLAAVGVFFTLLISYPFLESRLTRDRQEHHLLDRPRHTPNRTGTGAAGITFYGALWAAASADVIATQFHVSFEGVIWVLRVVTVLGPLAAFVIARGACLALQDDDHELLAHGAESGRVVRDPGGGYSEIHRPVEGRRRLGLTRPETSPHPVLDGPPAPQAADADQEPAVPAAGHRR